MLCPLCDVLSLVGRALLNIREEKNKSEWAREEVEVIGCIGSFIPAMVSLIYFLVA